MDLGVYMTLEPIIFGLWYRGVPINSLEGFPNNESIIAMVGLTYKNFAMGYSFDYTISNLGIDSGGAHEVSLTYTFTLTPHKPSKEVRSQKCPVPFSF